MIKIAIIGYGNLGRACESIAASSKDFELVGIFTRRNPNSLTSPYGTPFFRQEDIFKFENAVDVAAICTGSANDVTELGVKLASRFNTVDSFDTHAKMPSYFADMSRTAAENGRLCFVGIGWDPGLFSLMRALFEGVLGEGVTHTFWGRGVSQGHSEAIRKIDGVLDAKQYTVPKPEALALAREGGKESLRDRDKHRRECYVVVKEGADKDRIEREIKTMPNYFEPYDTTVEFISEDEFRINHGAMPHAGFVLRSGEANGKAQRLEFSLKLDSNPDFTASVLMAYARANAYLYALGERGAKSALDVPVSALYAGEGDIVKRFV
ncbi:MAG: diaminopimelate dehydrogenase [Bacteroides sp.]|nr:diaminopimelate dehydrogenase [Bacillota bacterium]MCM1394298.1 diaminopimelate dehydrogenase [[Eubacterium] siraeum]MCM1455618.1 diaminopimelate dehydrogenase [Bacteroides sp.]